MPEFDFSLNYRGIFADEWYWFYVSSDWEEKVFINMDHPIWKRVKAPVINDFDKIYHFKALKKEKKQFRLGFDGYYYFSKDEIKEFSHTGKEGYSKITTKE